jgi:hypothetical protein
MIKQYAETNSVEDENFSFRGNFFETFSNYDLKTVMIITMIVNIIIPSFVNSF